MLAAKRWEAFPSHPQLCIVLRMNSQSCAETFPVDKPFLRSVSPFSCASCLSFTYGYEPWDQKHLGMALLGSISFLPQHPPFPGASCFLCPLWRSCAALKSGKTATYSSLPLPLRRVPCWEWRPCPGVWPRSEETVGPEEL